MLLSFLAFLPELATGAGWLKVAKFLFKPQNLIRFAGIFALCFVLYKGYNWIYERGHADGVAVTEAHYKPIVAKVTKERDDLRTELTTLKDNVRRWQEESAKAQAELELKQKALNEDLQKLLADAKRRGKQNQKEVIDDLPQYISPAIDFYLPVGYLRMHNRSIEGENARPEDGVSFGGPGATAEASTLNLSRYAELVLVPNNDEAVQRGRVIEAWQQWYETTKLNFDEAQRKAAEAIPRLKDGKVSQPATEPSADVDTGVAAPQVEAMPPPSPAVATVDLLPPPDDEL